MRRHALIVITGDGGLIAGYLARPFLDRGLRVRCADIEPVREWYEVPRDAENLVLINQLVDIAQGIVGVKLKRRYKPDAPRGVAGRNSDNTKIRRYLNWEPETRLHGGWIRTYRWIYGEFIAKYIPKTAISSLTSTFSHGLKPIPVASIPGTDSRIRGDKWYQPRMDPRSRQLRKRRAGRATPLTLRRRLSSAS